MDDTTLSLAENSILTAHSLAPGAPLQLPQTRQLGEGQRASLMGAPLMGSPLQVTIYRNFLFTSTLTLAFSLAHLPMTSCQGSQPSSIPKSIIFYQIY